MKRRRRRPETGERRTFLQGLATGLAGAVAAPGLTAPTAHAGPPAPVQPSASPPRLFDAEELAVLESLSELLVPGSMDAGVPELVDRVGAVESPRDQRELRAALRAFEGRARLRFGSRWIGLGRDDQLAILNEAASGTGTPLGDSFVYLRERVARTYFATEPGMRKLGWTRRSAWSELPACNHPGDDHR